jgi:hypothetical protein
MADLKISQLTSATLPLAGTEVLPIVQSSSTRKVATDDLTVKNVRSNATTGILQIAGPGTGTTRVMTTPDANFTAARTDAAQTFTGTQTISSGNAILGTSSNWADTGRVEIPDNRSITSKGPTLFDVGSNFYINSGYKYAAIGRASNYAQANGYHFWYGTSTSGNAGDALTLNQYMVVDPFGGFNMPGIYANTVGATNRDVFVDNAGIVGYVSSIRASKININYAIDTSWLLQLKPATFNYRKKEEDGTYSNEAQTPIEYGLIAEDVELVNKNLCFYDLVDGREELRGVSYSKIVIPLLARLQELEARLAKIENAA